MMNKKNILVMLFTLASFVCSNAQTDITPPATPQNVKGFGYEKDIAVEWYHNTESDLAGYKLYAYSNGTFTFTANVPKEKSFYTSTVPIIGLTRYYKVSAVDSAGNESPLSDSVMCATHSMSNEEFLDMVQQATFRYFYDYAHPVSGLSRERLNSKETVTSGGSGFGLLALLVGIERDYISREEGVKRMLKILNFLNTKADRFHGAYSHWLNGTSGKVIPFGNDDNGGDIVETAYLIEGILAARQYFNQSTSEETEIRNIATQIWESVEWDWYRRYPTGNYIYWHWSPNFAWIKNMTVQGPNEAMIVYLLAIASPTHGVPATLFRNGWASSSFYKNSKSFYGYRIWVGWDYGGPLFFQHYSLLAFDPRNKKDDYCNYFNNAKNITLIHREYSIANPKKWPNYNANCWGLTASDDPTGYRVHEPTNDNGTITPSAALSSMPFTPQESIDVIKYLYRTYGSKVWGEYGFKDAFNVKENWYADSYIAIDQGPIICMIENYRSQLLWNKFMANPEIQPMMTAIGFVNDATDVDEDVNAVYDFNLAGNYPNPFNPATTIKYSVPQIAESNQNESLVTLKVFDILGREVATLVNEEQPAGEYEVRFDASNLSSGAYFYNITLNGKSLTGKMILQK